MKKVIFGLVALTVVVTFATTSFAIGLPKTKSSIANKAINTAKNKGLETVINDKIAKKNCRFKNATTVIETTCNLDKVIKELNNWRRGLEGTIANDVNVYVEAGASKSRLASQRAQEIRNKIRAKISWWDYYVKYNTASPDGLRIWVTVR